MVGVWGRTHASGDISCEVVHLCIVCSKCDAHGRHFVRRLRREEALRPLLHRRYNASNEHVAVAAAHDLQRFQHITIATRVQQRHGLGEHEDKVACKPAAVIACIG